MNWTQLIDDLLATGLTEAGIAAEISRAPGPGVTTQATIHRIKTGQISEPRWSIGDALRALHQDRCSPTSSAAA